ncbi:uncharacterized protein RJT20DRAFT_136893 [Scheffersomyces xylosifermentans]|uniref:uncharacterized protein n=1 Tax=Scheffersomyces xylosifermentans TaxID=1304137 RepID=UPI00315D976A
MSIGNSVVVGVVVALFLLILVLSMVLFACISCCCYAYVDLEGGDGVTTPGRLKFGLMNPSGQQFSGKFLEKAFLIPKSDGEPKESESMEHVSSSQIALNSFPISGEKEPAKEEKESKPTCDVSNGDIVVKISKDNLRKEDGTNSDYESAIDKFESLTEGLFPNISQDTKLRRSNSETFSRRLSLISYKRDSLNHFKTVVATPSEKKQSYVSDQYDSFSRTLMLQNMIQESVNNGERAIKEVRDPYSNSLISVGVIVVVVKPFHGTQEFEFKSLQTGDLLRIIKFYIREGDDDSVKSLHMSRKEKAPMKQVGKNLFNEDIDCEPNDKDSGSGEVTLDGYKNIVEELFVDKQDSNYDKIYCTGIILNTFLEFDSTTSDLSLRIKKTDSLPSSDSDLLKDFPLSIVTLETTVLKNTTHAAVGSSS